MLIDLIYDCNQGDRDRGGDFGWREERARNARYPWEQCDTAAAFLTVNTLRVPKHFVLWKEGVPHVLCHIFKKNGCRNVFGFRL